jgi:FkbM family methyltransferase
MSARTALKRLIKAGLARLDYTVHRVPPRAADPRYGIAFDFEYVLAHYLATRHAKSPPFFLQVGAYDGVTHDSFYAHVRAHRWHGILVEPQPAAFGRLVANYAGVDGLTFVNAAISAEAGTRPLYVILDDAECAVEPCSVASFDKAHVERFLPTDPQRHPGRRLDSLPVQCTTFEDVLVGVPRLDLLLVDTEGYDLEMLELFDFERFRPAIVRFEHKHLSRTAWDGAVELLARRGYRTVREQDDTTAYLAPGAASPEPAPQ